MGEWFGLFLVTFILNSINKKLVYFNFNLNSFNISLQKRSPPHTWEWSTGSNTTHILSSNHVKISLISPILSPRVLKSPEINVFIVNSEASNEHGVVDSICSVVASLCCWVGSGSIIGSVGVVSEAWYDLVADWDRSFTENDKGQFVFVAGGNVERTSWDVGVVLGGVVSATSGVFGEIWIGEFGVDSSVISRLIKNR